MQTTYKNTAKALMTASMGGALEMYDFVIYVYVAPIIAIQFFPKTNHSLAILATFALFAVGYFVRPLGGIVFGHLGDRYGRKKGLLITIIMMAIATTGIGLLPTYSQVGVLAPLFLLILRLLQGFAVGGDLPGAITFIYEIAPINRRGFYTSLVYFGVNFGILLASLVTFIVTSMMSSSAYHQWGWRVGFLVSVLLFVVGYYLRSQLEESPIFTQMQAEKKSHKIPALQLFKQQPMALLRAIILMWLFATIIPQVFLYMPTYLQTTVGLTARHALIFNTINLVLFTIFIPIMGRLSDQAGRRQLLFISALLMALTSYPLYSAMQTQNTTSLILSLASLAIFSATFIGSAISTLAAQFCDTLRYSGIGLSYNIGFAVFGGLTPLICTYLIMSLHQPTALAINLIVASILAAIITVPEILMIKDDVATM